MNQDEILFFSDTSGRVLSLCGDVQKVTVAMALRTEQCIKSECTTSPFSGVPDDITPNCRSYVFLSGHHDVHCSISSSNLTPKNSPVDVLYCVVFLSRTAWTTRSHIRYTPRIRRPFRYLQLPYGLLRQDHDPSQG